MKKLIEMRGERIDKEILRYLEKVELTATTEMVAKAIGVSWYTAQNHLYKLKDDGKVFMLRIGRQNQWILKERYERIKG
jgi:DNA-binding transcriptional ArsR family regulator